MAAEKDTSLGEFLRHERERRGITIEQVASATKVGVRTLHALEADQYAELPAKPFIRGFVTSYCRFIGLEPKDILARFDEFISLKATERPNRESGHSGYAFEKKDGEQQSRTILLIAMCTFIILGAVAMLVLKPSIRHHRGSHIDKLREAHSVNTAQTDPKLAPSPIPSVSPLPPVSAPAGAPPQVASQTPVRSEPSPVPSLGMPLDEPVHKAAGTNPADPLDSGHDLNANEVHHKIVLKTRADIWVRYQVDSRPVRKFIIRKGKILVLHAKNEIRLQVSNPKAASVSYNGHASKWISDAPDAVEKQGHLTLFFPKELAEKIEKPFADEGGLPSTADPEPDPSTSVLPLGH